MPACGGLIQLDDEMQFRGVGQILGARLLHHPSGELTLPGALNMRINHFAKAQLAAQPDHHIDAARLIKGITVESNPIGGGQLHIDRVIVQMQLVVASLDNFSFVRELGLPALGSLDGIDPNRRHYHQSARTPVMNVAQPEDMFIIIAVARAPFAHRLCVRTEVDQTEGTAGRIKKEIARLRGLDPWVHIVHRALLRNSR